MKALEALLAVLLVNLAATSVWEAVAFAEHVNAWDRGFGCGALGGISVAYWVANTLRRGAHD